MNLRQEPQIEITDGRFLVLPLDSKLE